MLNRAATYGRADKKPSDNKMNSVAGVTKDLVTNGGAMASITDLIDSLDAMVKPTRAAEAMASSIKAFDAVASATAVIDEIIPANIGK